MKHKTAQTISVKDEATGEVEVVFSTLNVIDKHGDITRPGAFSTEEVLISAYGHESWYGKLPVGKGVIHENGDEGIFKGRFFMDTTMGRDTFAVVKNTGSLQQWSYGYDVLKASHGEVDGKQVQYLESLKVWEVSPVLVGAGENTRTLTAKGAFPEMKFDQHISAVVTAVDELIDRAASVVTLRTEAGKSAVAPARAADLAELEAVMKRLNDLLQDNDNPADAEVIAALELSAQLDRASALLTH